MSEEKRFIKNKKVIALSISLVVAIVFAGILGFSFISVNNNYNNLSGDYDGLYIDYLELSIDFNNKKTKDSEFPARYLFFFFYQT